VTCIVALIDKGTVFLGGDHAATSGTFQAIRKDPKVFINGQFGIATCGSIRMHNILQYIWVTPKWRAEEMDIAKFMRNEFIDSLKVCFKSKGFGTTKDAQDSMSSSFIVGIAGRIFVVESDFQVGECDLPYYADGSGYAFALGSLYSSHYLENPKDRVILSLEAAEKFNSAVSGPFTIIEVA
jgi:ATP-dependent protease HslVU (ClpYQ) peptidase subunit